MLTTRTRGAPESLRRAIENPPRNAIRHTQPGFLVDVSVSRNDSVSGFVAVVRIRDHGPGVPQAYLEKIFLPFHKVEGEAASRGAGLGLAITERIVRSHKGSVRAVNAADGGLIVEMELLPLTA